MADPLDRLNTALAGRYNVERELGRGGMATVYLAEDLTHGRKVAIKVLHPELAASIGPERFVREIDIAARLNHPHIVPLFESGRLADPDRPSNDFLYYVMPYVAGESLRDLLRRTGKLPPERALRIAEEVAGALGYAHRQGIVHRDVKPANILLSDGHAVVADFGIARAVDAARGGGLTEVGMAVGTPEYMSPEQALGGTDVDGRADIYALGCVLHEMLSGSPPFTGKTPQSVVAQAVTGRRARLEDAPAAVRQVVGRAMSMEPTDRFASAEQLSEALSAARIALHGARRTRSAPIALAITAVAAVAAAVALWLRPQTTPVAADAQVIAVLPFAASGPDVALLSEGMVDLLTTNLSGVGGIRMIDPRLVLRRFGEERASGPVSLDRAQAIGRDVEARAILTGSVVEVGDAVRLRAVLHSVDDVELGGATVDGPVELLLAMVDSLSVRLLSEIWRSSESLPDVRLSAVTSGSVEAVRDYLAGAQFARRAAWDSAITHFDRAIAADSAFALAHILLADAYWWVDGPASPRGQEHLEWAVAFQDRLPPRERLLARAVQAFAGDRVSGVESMRRFVERYPRDVFGWMAMGEVQFHSNDVLRLGPEDLRAPFERATELDSTYVPAYFHLVELALSQGDSVGLAGYLDRLDAMAAYEGHRQQHRLAMAIVWGAEDSVASRLERLLAVPDDAVMAVGQALEAIGNLQRARTVYQRGLASLRGEETDPELLQQRLEAGLARVRRAPGER
jgi:tRNA A-37 threonylcarbamoyl transferase component Bud32/TolB-like protein